MGTVKGMKKRGRNMIVLEEISKTFRVARREAGFGNAVRALFHKEYTEIKALDNISFSIEEGEMVGYLGPNGAGKSSTIKVMSGILTPDSGACTINGRIPWKDRTRHVGEIGVVFGQRSQLWWDVPVMDSFELLRDIYRVPEGQFRKNAAKLTELLNLGDLLKTPARQLSLGQRMRCEIAAALLHSPKTLFLDEPTIGLDAVSKKAVREFIREINRTQGVTVLLTTHDMQDMEALANRILLIGKGKILLDGTLEKLQQRYGAKKKLTVCYTKGEYAPIPGAAVVDAQPGRLTLALDSAGLPVPQAVSYLAAMLEITDLSVEGTNVDEMVVSLYRDFQIA